MKNHNIKRNKKKFEIKLSRFNIIPIDNSKKMKTINNDDFLTTSTKLSKGFNIKSIIQKSNNNNEFNYKVVSLGDNVSLESESKDFYSLDFEALIKRSIRLNLVSPESKALKIYRNENSQQNSNNELNIKASPAFGSTFYSFSRNKDYPNKNYKSK